MTNTNTNTNTTKEVYKNGSYFMNLNRNILVEVKRVDNDLYGNPLYRVYPINFTQLKKLSTPIRRNFNKKYYLVQSYNIVDTLISLFNEMEKIEYFKTIDPLEAEYLNGYKKVEA